MSRALRISTPVIARVAIIAVLTGAPGLVAGVLVGNGAALWMVSRWLERWEARRGRRLLREPRWRWRRPGRNGWGRGRGIMDPQDFYVESAVR